MAQHGDDDMSSRGGIRERSLDDQTGLEIVNTLLKDQKKQDEFFENKRGSV